MQQMMPPQGPLFPDNRQEQQKPRFPSNAQAAPAQNYEPQLRMQQSGSLPIYTSARYASGTLQPVRASQPVSTMQPMATMPTAQQYQAQLAAQTAAQQQSQEKPLVLHTVQGQPVVINADELRQALAALNVQNAPQEQKQTKKLRQSKKQKSQQQKEQKQSRFMMKMSVTWFVFGLIGMGTAGVFVLKIVITFLLRLKGQL
ncbi:MAG: hypothetical protein IJ343_02605 [Clostridia bacterium]|nr:hypothetical protein [Clostridia bacterium]